MDTILSVVSAFLLEKVWGAVVGFYGEHSFIVLLSLLLVCLVIFFIIKPRMARRKRLREAIKYSNSAKEYYKNGKYNNALEQFEQARVIREEVLGKDHPATAATYNNIAGVYDNQGDYVRALEWYEKT